jgi:hypothetical protein
MQQSKKVQGQYLLARQIVAYVFEQKLDRGHHLVETGLAHRFAVSRTLIRAALKRLANESIVETPPQPGLLSSQGMGPARTGGRPSTLPADGETACIAGLSRDRISGRIPERITQAGLIACAMTRTAAR